LMEESTGENSAGFGGIKSKHFPLRFYGWRNLKRVVVISVLLLPPGNLGYLLSSFDGQHNRSCVKVIYPVGSGMFSNVESQQQSPGIITILKSIGRFWRCQRFGCTWNPPQNYRLVG
jgi:hypothetical protein